MTIEEAKEFRRKIEHSASKLSDEEALESVELFPTWNGERNYLVDDRVQYKGQLYKCVLAVSANPSWTPDASHTIWQVIAQPSEDGAIDNPIEAAAGMRYELNKYYLDSGITYKCIRDDTGSGTVLYYLPSQLVGMYFEQI